MRWRTSRGSNGEACRSPFGCTRLRPTRSRTGGGGSRSTTPIRCRTTTSINRVGLRSNAARPCFSSSTAFLKISAPPSTTCFHPAGAARFIEFLKAALSAEELQRYDWPEGNVVWATIRIGDSVVGVSEPGRHGWAQPMPTMIYLYVPDADAAYDQAIRAGAESIHPPADQFYGERSGGVPMPGEISGTWRHRCSPSSGSGAHDDFESAYLSSL